LTSKIKTPKILHDIDWSGWKADDTVFVNEKRFNIIAKIILQNNPSLVLDVGCGSGYLAYLLKKQNSNLKIDGFDISEEALKRANLLDQRYILNIDEKSIPQENNYYDVVVCSEVLEHIYDFRHCIIEIKRVLIPGGICIFTTPNFSFWRYRIQVLKGNIPSVIRDERHLHAFNFKILKKIIIETGLGIEKELGITQSREGFLRFI